MHKKISGKKLDSIGGRVIPPKSKPVEKQVAKPADNKFSLKQKAMVEEAVRSAQAAEAEAIRAANVSARQMDLMQQLIDKMPVHEGLPPITGFEFQRGADGVATGITFIREKQRLN